MTDSFTPPAQAHTTTAPRYKTALLIWAAVFPTVLVFSTVLSRLPRYGPGVLRQQAGPERHLELPVPYPLGHAGKLGKAPDCITEAGNKLKEEWTSSAPLSASGSSL
jgi:hypothetical protein